MTFDSDTHSNPTTVSDELGAFEDEFDRLLDQSSLGSPNARAIQAMTSPDIIDTVHHRVDAHARNRKNSDCRLGSDCDVDDVLLNLVLNAAQATEFESGTRLPTQRDAERDLDPSADRVESHLLGRRRWTFEADTLLSADASRDMLTYLVGTRVFDYVRPDVARSIVEVAFLAPTIARSGVFDGAVARCGIADELIDDVRRGAAVEAVAQSSAIQVRPLPWMRDIRSNKPVSETIAHHRRPYIYELMCLFVFYGDGSVPRGRSHPVDDAVGGVDAGTTGSLVRWRCGPSSSSCSEVVPLRQRPDSAAVESTVVTFVAAMFLGLLHLAPPGIPVLLAALHDRVGMAEIARDRVMSLKLLNCGDDGDTSSSPRAGARW